MKLIRRDSDANVIEIGTIEYDGQWKFAGHVSEGLQQWLKRGIEFGGKMLTDKALFDKLPFILSGDRLWAVV